MEDEAAALDDGIAELALAEKRRLIDETGDEDSEILVADWRGPGKARPEQLPPPGDWRVWLLLAGRGFGKTRSGAEWVREQVKEGRAGRVALVAPTAADARDVMIEGESGILAVTPDRGRPLYEPSKRRVTWPNGAIATAYSAEEPDRLRGPQHDAAWCDELAVWRHDAAWDMLMFGLRLGHDPRCVVTTTPKPRRLLRHLLHDPSVAVTRGTTFDNRDHLAPAFFDAILKRYRGTRLGRQELLAELLEDVPGALWSRDAIERGCVPVAPALARIVVAIDPAVSTGDESDETGIIVAALGEDGHAYVLDDLSGRHAPHEWARRAIAAYKSHQADRIVAETNNGRDLVEATLRVVDPNAAFRAVHASRGKAVRAEPVAALYEQGRVHHVGHLTALEDQMCEFTGGVARESGHSPDRVDALVWAITDLMIAQSGTGILEYYRGLAREQGSLA
jgi:predicted phage terminase large subunit-like protein